MAVSFALQSNLRCIANSVQGLGVMPRQAAGARPLSSADWLAYFRKNAVRCRPISWEAGACIDSAQLARIASSLQAWQLGETSEGHHLRRAAARHAERIGDPLYPAVVEFFIREEQRHGELLGRFLDLAGVGRRRADWGDSLFRAARYCVTSMEMWTTPVVMVEALAMVYYNAILRATPSPVLRSICAQILADEVPHIRFQCERLALLLRRRPRPLYWLTMLCQRLFFLLIVLLVWLGHRRALRAGGYPWRRYWRSAWAKMTTAWRLMEPRRYAWEQTLVCSQGNEPLARGTSAVRALKASAGAEKNEPLRAQKPDKRTTEDTENTEKKE